MQHSVPEMNRNAKRFKTGFFILRVKCRSAGFVPVADHTWSRREKADDG